MLYKGYNKTEYCQYETKMTNNHLYECEMKTVMIEESHMRKYLKEDGVKCNASSILALRIRTSLNFLPRLKPPLWETSTYLINISLARKQTINTSYLHFSHVNKASFRYRHLLNTNHTSAHYTIFAWVSSMVSVHYTANIYRYFYTTLHVSLGISTLHCKYLEVSLGQCPMGIQLSGWQFLPAQRQATHVKATCVKMSGLWHI